MARVTAWKQWMRVAWAQGGHGRGAVFRQFKDHVPMTASLLQRHDGSLTGDADEIDDLLHDAWDPIFRAYAKEDEPAWEPFAAQFGKYVKGMPFEVTALTGEKLKE
eukprot:11997349-Karenia_brevis.AAC.1